MPSSRSVRIVVSALFLALVSTGAVPEARAAGLWESHGPGGGITAAIAVDPSNPSTLYVGTTTRLFKSVDAGASWHAASTGLPVDAPRAVVVDPSDANVVYVAMEASGVFKSTNGGLGWSAASTGLPGAPFAPTWSLVIDPQTPTTLYVADNSVGQVYKSTDGAASWNPATSGLPATLIYSLAIDPATPATVYVGGDGMGVYKTVDGGGSWAPVNNGLTAMTVGSLVISPATPARIYAGTTMGVFRSNNGGQIWNDLNDDLTDLFVTTLAVDPTDASEVYVGTGDGLYRSHNGGNSWSPAAAGLVPGLGPWMMAIDPITPTTVYATLPQGVFKSTSSVVSWSLSSDGIAATDVRAVAVDPVTPTTVYAATYDQRVHKSTDGTRTWSATDAGPAGVVVGAIAVDPSATNVVYAGTDVGVSKSIDGGATWNPASTGLGGANVASLVVDPATTTTLYAGSVASGVFKSTDGAGSWSPANAGLEGWYVRVFAIDPTTPTTLYAATNGGVFKTVDGAMTWNPATAGLSGGGLQIRDLAIDPSTPTTLYAATQAGVVRSIDGAGSWGSPTTVGAWSVEVDPVTTSTVYAAIVSIGVAEVQKSTTSGATWSTMNDGMFGVPVRLAIAPSGPTRLYVGSQGGGVFAYHDCGNGAPEAFEECDDGNVVSGDGCSAICTLEPCSTALVPLCGLARQAKMQLSEKTPGKEKLKIQWKKLAGSSSPATFGNPIGGSTRVMVCVYDDAKALVAGYEVDRAGDVCAGKPCWKEKGTIGFGYKDTLAAADGITAVSFKGGPSGKGQASVSGANNAAKGQTALPTGVVAAITGHTPSTVQLSTSDGFCIGATMTETTKDEGGVYKAQKK